MKSPLRRWAAGVMATVLVSARAATLSVAPAATSNTHPGLVTLNVAGLTNTEAVVVQQFLDLNANGAVDSGEPLVDTFPIADGAVSLIGGRTNRNVPFDSNPAAGDIATSLMFAAPRAIDNLVGRHLYRVISPSGRFAPADAVMVVTNAPANPLLAGTVFRGGQPATNAVVVALRNNGGYAGGAVADAAGRYALRLPASTYLLVAAQPNTFMNLALAPLVTLTNGMNATNHLFLNNGTVTISGAVHDAAGDTTLGGLLVFLRAGSFLSLFFSASDGTFSAAVPPSLWQFEAEGGRAARRGYLTPDALAQVDTTTGAVANVNLELPKANAMFYGRLTDQLGAPVSDVRIGGSDDGGAGARLQSCGFTDANGEYSLPVLAESGVWSASADASDPKLAAWIVSAGASVDFTNGQAHPLNFSLRPATANLSGHVRDHLGNPVVGVRLGGDADIEGLNYSSPHVVTDAAGQYSLAVAPGEWRVQFRSDESSPENLAYHGLVDLLGPAVVNVPAGNAVRELVVYPIGVALLGNPQAYGGGYFGLSAYGPPNTTYEWQVCTESSLSVWSTIATFVLTSSPLDLLDNEATNQFRVYRLKEN